MTEKQREKLRHEEMERYRQHFDRRLDRMQEQLNLLCEMLIQKNDDASLISILQKSFKHHVKNYAIKSMKNFSTQIKIKHYGT